MSTFESASLSNALWIDPRDSPKYKDFKPSIIRKTEQAPWWGNWDSDLPIYKLKGQDGREYWETKSIYEKIIEKDGKKYYSNMWSYAHDAEIIGEYRKKPGSNGYELESVDVEVDPYWTNYKNEPVAEDTDMGKNRGGGGGGGGTTSGITYDQQLKLQRDSQEASAKLMREQVELQNKFALEAELRLKKQQEETRLQEEFRRQRIASEKKQKLQTQEAKESAVFKEMTGQAKFDPSYFTGRVNLDMPTIERPSYEGEGRPS